MSRTIDQAKLIEAADELVDHGLNEGYIYSAAEARREIQHFDGDDGNKYTLEIILRPYKASNMTLYLGDD